MRGEDTPIRYEKNGVSLWYATQDAPAAEGNLSASPTGRLAGVRLAFAVKPSAARNTVEVRYRVNGGTVVKLRASLARSDVRSNAQYFAATLPEFKVGDTVEYAAVATWPKGQVPDEAEAAKFPSLHGQQSVYASKQLHDYASGARLTGPNNVMQTIAKRLSDDDMRNVSAYVQGIR